MADRIVNFSIKKWPEGERPREKLIKLGAESLTDAELLAIILRVGNQGSSAIDMGRQLVGQMNGLSGIDRAHVEEIRQIKGLGIAKTAQVKAAIEMGKRVRRQNAMPISFDSAEEIARFCYPKFEGKRHEQFIVLLLDGQNHLLAERTISEGIPTQSVVYTRKVMEEALRVSASSIVVVHNHPSGEAKPSAQDVETTRKLKEAADVLEIILLDHIILGQESFYSFMEHENILEGLHIPIPPIEIQSQIVNRNTTAREEIAMTRSAISQDAGRAKETVEQLILGTLSVEEL